MPSAHKVRYPSLHFTSKEPVKLGGTHATIKYRHLTTEVDKTDPANHKYHHTVEIHGIEPHAISSGGPDLGSKLKNAMRKGVGMDAEDMKDGGIDENTETS